MRRQTNAPVQYRGYCLRPDARVCASSAVLTSESVSTAASSASSLPVASLTLGSLLTSASEDSGTGIIRSSRGSEKAISPAVFISEDPVEELASCGDAEPESAGSLVICVQPEKRRLRASKTKVLLFKIYIHLSEYRGLFWERSRYSENYK